MSRTERFVVANTQMTLRVLLPTLAAVCGSVAALTGAYVNSGRFNTIDSRLAKLESEVPGLDQTLWCLEGSLGGK
jgi:L-cysteine desulfidase